ncbi:MAG: energy transducer TonB [Deltaproteobacteria bacterium]|nr:energy transducer TonB [Deltaproteobacteria bacterium]MBN2671520.1 energy transducer TonB [Deltaproteobacteria bacterium]
MNTKSTGRHSIAMILSVAIHVGVAMVLLGLPKHLKTIWDTVDIEMFSDPPEPEPEPELAPEPEPEPEVEVEPDKPKLTPQPKAEMPEPEPEPEEIPEEPPPPPEAKEAPPVFDLGDNTFAQNGQGAGWALQRSEGNTKFAGVQKGTESVRGTAPKRTETTTLSKPKPTFSPVPAKDWSRKPEPADSVDSMPEYPFEAKRDGVEGKVRLQVFIGKDGLVKKVRIISDPGKGLGESSKKHALQKKWRPALDKNGNPVDTIIVWTYTFILDN